MAFLAGEWTRAGLLARGHAALDERPRWLARLVTSVLAGYPRPPLDRHRELAAWIDIAGFPKAGPSGEIFRWFTFEPAMGPMPWPVPEIASVLKLADFLGLSVSKLEWLADVKSLERLPEGDERLRHYRYMWRVKANGDPRLIEAPKTRLRAAQRLVLREILDPIPAHDAAHGFVMGRSVTTFVEPHIAAPVLVKLDLEDFFGCITAARVFGVFRLAGYPEPVAHMFTGLVTNTVPDAITSAAPRSPATPERRRFLLRRHLATPHLPQGAPTSPALANLCAFGLDQRLSGLATSLGLRYTRYADDLAFSGSIAPSFTDRLIRQIDSIAAAEGFRLNSSKVRITTGGQRQSLAGVVVNRHPNLERREYDRLRATLHNVARKGLDAENRSGHARFADHLTGRVSWASSLNPQRGLKLRRMLEATAQQA